MRFVEARAHPYLLHLQSGEVLLPADLLKRANAWLLGGGANTPEHTPLLIPLSTYLCFIPFEVSFISTYDAPFCTEDVAGVDGRP